MKQADIEKLVDRYQAKADKAFNNYQETGVQRYQNDWHNNEDLADALRIAAGAADEHNSLISLRSDMANIATKARDLGTFHEYPEVDALLKEIRAVARIHGMTGIGGE